MRLAMVEPTPITLAGATWPVLYNLWAVRQIEHRHSPTGDWLTSGLDGFKKAQLDMAAGQIDALAAILWAGLLHDSPALTFDDALSLLDEASPGELVTLPTQLVGAIMDSVGRQGGQGGGGGPWDWETAMGWWFDHGHPMDGFWRETFRTFASLSAGLSKLYEKSRQHGSGNQASAPPDGWSLIDLLSMKGR